MADLNFSIGLIKDQITKDLGDIKKELENFGKSHPISLNVVLDGKKLGEQIETLNGKTVSINVEVGNLQKVTESLENLKNVVGKGSNPIPLDKLFGFNDLDQRINKFVADMQNKLSQATSEHAFKVGTGHIENLSIDINKIATDMRNALTIVPSGNFEEVRAQIDRISQAFRPLQEGTKLFDASSKNMQSKLSEIAGSISAIQTVTNTPDMFNGFQKQILEMMGMLGSIAEVVKGNVEAVARAIKDMKLDHFGESIKKVSDSLAELTGNVEKFGTAMANDKGMRDFITGLGAMINTVKNNIDTLRGKGIGETDMSKGVIDMTRNYEKLNDAIMRLDQAKQRAQGEMSIAKAVGLSDADTAGTLKYIQTLDMVRAKLMELHGDSGKMVQKNVFTSAFWSVQEVEAIMRVLNGADASLAKDSTAISQLFNALVREVNQYSQSLHEAKLGTDQVSASIKRLEEIKASINGSIASNLLPPQDVDVLNATVARIDEILKKLTSPDRSTNNKLGILGREAEEIRGFEVAARNAKNAVKIIEGENNKLAQSTIKATNKIVELEGTLQRLNSIKTKGDLVGADTTALSQKIGQVEALLGLLREIKQNGGKTNAGQMFQDIINANAGVVRSAKNTANAVKEETRELAKNSSSKTSAAGATSKLTEEEQRLTKAIQNATNAGKGQSQIISDLRSMAMQYASVWGMYGFAKEVAQVTGELELQKRSLEVILDSVGKASELYGQIQALSQQSPYDFQSLLKSTRQLAAFGIETKDLFNTMKALSDIGAGLSVDVNRLILAFGHTRSYGYLSGIQNRQFENAGIDLMGELMKKYNAEADENRLQGRMANYVTRKDLFKRMRSRDIPFEDVRDVVLGLDKPGGKFYNMQERQFDTLGGKLRNLNNNYNIMLSEIGQAQMGFLSGTVDAINSATEHWQRWYLVIKDVVTALVSVKLIALALGQSGIVGKVFNSAMAVQMANARHMSILNGGWGMDASRGNTNLGNVYGRAILANDSMSKLQKAKAVMFKNVDEGTRTHVLKNIGMVDSQIDKINKRVKAGLGAWERLGLSVKAFAASVKTAFMSLATNPMTWIFAAVAAVTHIIGRINEANELKEKLLEDTQRAGLEDSDAIEDVFKANSTLVKRNSTGREISVAGTKIVDMEVEIDRDAVRVRGAQEVLAEVTKELQQYSPLYQGQIIDIMALEDDVDKVQKAFEYLNDAQKVNRVMSVAQGGMENVLTSGPKWYNFGLTDSAIEDLKEYKTELQEIRDTYKQLSDNERAYANLSAKYKKQIEDRQAVTDESRLDAMMGLHLTNPKSRESGDIGTFVSDAKSIAEQFLTDFKVYFDDNEEESAMYFQTWLSNLFSQAKISDAMSQQNITNILLDAMESQGGGFIKQYMQTMNLQQHFTELAKAQIKDSTAPEDLEDLLKELSAKTIDWGKAQGYDLKKLGMDHAEAYRKGMMAAFNEIAFTDQWEKRAGEEFVLNTTMRNQIKLVSNKHELYEKVKDDYKKNKEFIEAEMKTLPKIQANLGLGIGLSMDKGAMEKAINAIKAQITLARDEKTRTKLQNILDTEIMPIYNALGAVQEDKAWAKREGYSLEDKKKKNGGTKKDTQLDAWKKRFEDLKKFRQEYEKWLGVYKNSESAFAHVSRIYKDLNIPKDAIVSLRGYSNALSNLGNEVKKFQNKGNNPQGRKSLVNDIFVFRDSNIGMQDFKEESDRYLSSVQENIKVLKQAWELFKSVRESTGDSMLAASLSGLKDDAALGNFALQLQELIVKRMQNIGLPSTGLRLDKTASNKEIEDSVGAVFGEGATDKQKEQIASIIELIKTWRDLMQDLGKTSTTAMAKLLGDVTDYASKVKKINDEYQQNIESILNSNGTPEEKARATEIAEDKQKIALKDIEPETIRFYEAITTLNKDAARQIANDLIEAYQHSFEIGRISAEDFDKKVQEILSRLNDRGTGKRTIFDRMGSFFFNRNNNKDEILGARRANTERIGQLMKLPNTPDNKTERTIRERLATALNNSYLGLGGLKERRIASAGSFIADNIRNVNKWQSTLIDPTVTEKEKKEAQKMLNRYSKEQENYSKWTKDNDGKDKDLDFMEKLQKGAEEAARALSDMSKLAGDASGMFASFGNKEMAGIMSDVGNIAGVGANIAQGIASGNPVAVLGGAMNLVSSLNAAHDNKLKRQIEALQENNAALEANTKVIKSARARTLGYDDGSLLKQYQREARDSMKSFYTTGGATGYRAEYNNLVALRDNQYSILSKQEKMKNKSESDILATKEKIAELDDQIKFYISDVAAELWSIDLKDWASQISDALCTAFENGENAAKAYKNAVTSIMQQVMNSMMKVGILEPMFKSLQDKLFGKNGLFDINDVEGSMGQVTAYLGQFFGEGGEGYRAINAAMAFTNGFEDVMKQYGLTVRSKDANTLSSSIQGTSEETTDLLAAYVNALRQDVSILRLFTEEFMTEKWEDYINSLTGSGSHLENIDKNILAIKTLFEQNGDLYNAITRIDNDLHSVIYGQQSVKMR